MHDDAPLTRTGGSASTPGADVGRRAPRGPLGSVLRGARDVARLLVPVACAGCGLPDVALCPGCAGPLTGPLVRCEQDVPRLDRMDGSMPLPVWRVAPYTASTRELVVAWKDHGRADLTRVLRATARRAGHDLAPVVAGAAGGAPMAVVPVPSSPGARRRRGADLVCGLAGAVAQGLVDGGVPARAVPVLVRRRGGRDQVGLGARARSRNAAGSVRLRRGRPSDPGGTWCLLVDDVVTTGSTLAACDDLLADLGALVMGAVVVAATPAPGARRTGPDTRPSAMRAAFLQDADED